MSATTEHVLTHHLESIGAGDVDAIMSDYADDAILFTPDGLLQGHAAIRELFDAFTTDLMPPGSSFEMKCMTIEGDYAYILWSAESPTFNFPIGTDTFYISDGKIIVQSFAATINPK